MTIQSAIILPLIAIIIFSIILSIAFITSEFFYEHEDGMEFLIAINEGSSYNGYCGRELNLERKQMLTGVRLSCLFRDSKISNYFSLYRANRFLFGTLMGH